MNSCQPLTIDLKEDIKERKIRTILYINIILFFSCQYLTKSGLLIWPESCWLYNVHSLSEIVFKTKTTLTWYWSLIPFLHIGYGDIPIIHEQLMDGIELRKLTWYVISIHLQKESNKIDHLSMYVLQPVTNFIPYEDNL